MILMRAYWRMAAACHLLVHSIDTYPLIRTHWPATGAYLLYRLELMRAWAALDSLLVYVCHRRFGIPGKYVPSQSVGADGMSFNKQNVFSCELDGHEVQWPELN